MGRVKVTIAISTSRILFGILPETVEKTIFLHNGDSFKDYCFQFGLNRKIDSIKIIKTECLGPCATGDCCDDPRYELYTGKDRRFQDYIEPNFNAIMTSYQSGSTNFGGYPINYCKNECETMADAWVQDLSRCLGSNPQRLERVRRGLIDVCQQSCMAQSGNPTIHPFSDLNPAPSFESVIVAEFGPITDTCAYDLISDPYPWGKVPIIDRTFATETNTAICYRLNTLRAEAQSNGYTNDVDRVHDYLTAFYQPYYDLIKEELQDLFTGCYDCNGIMPIPVELPAFMDGNAKPCFTCDQFDVLIQQFNTKYPGVTPATDTYEILFKNFVNHQTGYSHAFANYYDFMEKCSLNVNSYRDTGRICETPQVMEVEIDLIAQCMDEKFQNALSNATNIYNAYIDSVIRAFRNNYTSKCLEAKIWLETDAKLYEYHYTLYYYDQAGNLVKTVPPKGVEFLTPANISLLWANRNNYIVPAHTLATIYEYNSFNQVVRQKTPDAGISEFWYDRLGRLTVSQNSEQKTPSNGGSINRYSYTKYEPILGRIKEVGEKTGAGNIASINTRSNTQLLSWLSSGTDIQITETIYDKADLTRVANSNITNEQYHFTSRNRVVATLYSKVKYADPNLHDAATHYSYDINGNAKTIWQENERLKEADPTTEGLKRMDYEFDLISGKVNRVFYQKSKGDQFIYRYKYDAENRITEALTSRDGILWQTDASYKYYLHGPLARTEIGTHKVQGVDLAYTLQGWMKFMNAPVMNVAADIGRDGNTQIPNNIFSRVSRDAYGYGISYYENDFKAIGQNSPINLAEIVPNGMGTGKNLFNGNIRATTLQIKHLGDPVTYSYSYDQLNRLVKMRQHQTAYTAPAGSTAAALAIANPTSEYKENIRYDANGNIMDYLRNGTTANSNPLEMDDMRYEYYANTNKLRRVHDPVPSGNYGEDIDQQINANNYKYDNIGNLISDAAENISSIKWNVYGKISRIMKSDANNTVIEYEYDATGNRIYKKVTSAGQEKYTYYIKDAQGNSMALYIRTDAGVVEWGEQHLYGSSRLGVRRFGMPVPAGAPLPAAGATMEGMFEYGRSQYELSNHLGNVLATITDKKVGIELGTTGTVEYFEADVATANDYYPFGMTMPGRKYSSSSSTYRYGFNGKENDKEVMGEANFQDYGLRMYNVRLGRFISVDPLTPEYPELTPYQFASNTPISAIDLDGGEAKVVTYGVKMKADDNFVKTCGTACARALGVKPEGISTGKNLLTVLRTASSGSSQNISAWANFGHSWNSGLYLTNDNGFYKGGLAAGGAGTANFNDLLSQSSKGQISFSKHSLFIFASCGTAGDGAGGHGAGKGAYSSASFAASIGNYVNKNYILPNGAFTGTYKITTIGATDLSNLHTDGTVTTDGTFIKTENTYQIERKVITETKTTGWWIFSKTKTTTRYEDKTTLTGTKTTDLGKKINPAEVIKNHNDQDTKTP
jgi:RHS repeat-associated protein